MNTPFTCRIDGALYRVDHVYWDRHWLVRPLIPWATYQLYLDMKGRNVCFS